MEKTMKKDTPEKRPRGRPPAGAVLVDGRWQTTERSVQMAAERMLRAREIRRTRLQAMRELLRLSHPELFVARGHDPKQTKLTPEVRSKERNVDLLPYQKSDTSSNAASDTFAASLLWRPQQRDNGTPSLSRGSASL